MSIVSDERIMLYYETHGTSGRNKYITAEGHLADLTVDHLCSAFLRRILRRMKELGLNKTELAKRMNVSRPYVAAILSRDVNITFRTAAKLARALQMDFAPELGLQTCDSASHAPDSGMPAELQIVTPDGRRQSYHIVQPGAA